MTYTKPKQPTQALSYRDRQTIADVLNLDETGSYHYSPNEIASIYIDGNGNQVQVALVDGRNRMVDLNFFRSVLEQRKENIEKHIEAIVEAEQAREESLQTQAFLDAHLDMMPQDDSWLTSPVSISICPVVETEESVRMQNYGCLPCEYEITQMLKQKKVWMCHSNPNKPCAATGFDKVPTGFVAVTEY